jgi:hypothetical protein
MTSSLSFSLHLLLTPSDPELKVAWVRKFKITRSKGRIEERENGRGREEKENKRNIR